MDWEVQEKEYMREWVNWSNAYIRRNKKLASQSTS